MNFDGFLSTVNGWGRYQKTKLLFVCLTYMVPPIMVYTWSFTAATPDFRCRHPGQTSDAYTDLLNDRFNQVHQPSQDQCAREQTRLSLKECQRCYRQSSSNGSSTSLNLQPCQTYVFDRSIYERTLVEEWSMVCDRVSYRFSVQMIYFVGFMCGAIFFGTMADKFGRRPIMSISFLLMTFAGFLCTFGPQHQFGFWPSYLIFVFARFLLAFSTRGISESGFVLGSEMVEPRKRLMVGIVMDYFFTLGEFLLVFLAYFIRTWRLLTLTITLFTIPFCFFYFVLPESPRWLVSKGRFDEAEKILRHIASVNKRQFDPDAFEQLKATHEKTMSHSKVQLSFRSLFRTKIIRVISITLFFQWFAQNLVFYGVSQNTGAWQFDPYLSFVLSTLVELFAYIVVHLILDRLGRKGPYCTFAIAFGLLALSVLPVQSLLAHNPAMQRTMLLIINILLKFFASASFATIYLFSTELFPTNLRTTSIGICSMIGRLGAIFGTFSNDYLARISIGLPVTLCGIVSLFAGIVASIFPETLNKSLPQTVEDVEDLGLQFCLKTTIPAERQ